MQFLLFFTLLLTSGMPCAHAALGDTKLPRSVMAATPVTPDATIVKSQRNAALRSGPSAYSQQTTALPSGTEVTEYLDPGNRVFAISWSGPVLPPMAAWLGTYFPTFSTALQKNSGTAGIGSPWGMENSQLVVRSSGRMRSFSGYAYAPTLVPAGLDLNDVLP